MASGSNREVQAGFDAAKRLLTIAQAAEACQISERQLLRMIKAGTLRVKRFGKAVRIHPKDLGL